MPIAREITDPKTGRHTTIVESSSETGGAYTLLRIDLPPGEGAPSHLHTNRAESFTVLEGELEVTMGDDVSVLQPGESVTAGHNQMHEFWNKTEKNILIDIKIEPGHLGFENLMRVRAGLVRDGETNARGLPKSFVILSLLVSWAEAFVPSIKFRMMRPMLWFGAWLGRNRGLDAQLIDRYEGELPRPAA